MSLRYFDIPGFLNIALTDDVNNDDLVRNVPFINVCITCIPVLLRGHRVSHHNVSNTEYRCLLVDTYLLYYEPNIEC